MVVYPNDNNQSDLVTWPSENREITWPTETHEAWGVRQSTANNSACIMPSCAALGISESVGTAVQPLIDQCIHLIYHCKCATYIHLQSWLVGRNFLSIILWRFASWAMLRTKAEGQWEVLPAMPTARSFCCTASRRALKKMAFCVGISFPFHCFDHNK